jgi:hypothetical protein
MIVLPCLVPCDLLRRLKLVSEYSYDVLEGELVLGYKELQTWL